MSRPNPVFVVGALLCAACPSGSLDVESEILSASESQGASDGLEPRARLDEGALVAGATVVLTDGDTRGHVSVPLAEPLPDADPMSISMELLDAVHCIISTGGSNEHQAELSGAQLILSALANPGEFRWEINSARDEVTIDFVNETVGGLSLSPGVSYFATLSVTANEYVEVASAFSFPVTVMSEGG